MQTERNNMKHTKEQIQDALNKQFNGKPTYFIWQEIPPVKIWYDEIDNTFKTNVGISVCFDDYELENCYKFDGKTPELGIEDCIDALYEKIYDTYLEKGIMLHELH